MQPEAGAPPSRKRLHDLVGVDLLRRLSAEMEQLNNRLQEAKAGQASSAAWSSNAGQTLMEKCLLYLQAAQSRIHSADADLCATVDLLFEEIAHDAKLAWSSYTIFSADDSYDKDSEVVRTRYPISGVWDLPLSVHEFGHYLCDKLRAKSADGSRGESIKKFIEDEAKRRIDDRSKPYGRHWAIWLEEVFADVFATVSLGPAFGYASVVLRFNPTDPSQERDGKHPADAKRVFIVLTALQLLNTWPEIMGKLTPSTKLIRNYWQSACQSAGTEAEAEEQEYLFSMVDRFCTDLRHAALRRWDPLPFQDFLLGASDVVPSDTRFADLLNAAWLCRIQNTTSAKKVNEKFLKFCQHRINDA